MGADVDFQGRRRGIVVEAQDLEAVLTTKVTGNFWCQDLHITNDSGVSAVVSVYDLQSPAKAVIAPMTLTPGGIVSLASKRGRYMKGGLQWSSSQPGVVGYVNGESAA